MIDKKFATTIRLDWDSRYVQKAKILEIPEPESSFNYRFIDELRLFGIVLMAAWREATLLLFSSRGKWKPELLAAAVIGLWPRRLRPKIAFYGEMYQPDSGLLFVLEYILVKLANRSISRYIVASEVEVEIFSDLWNIAPTKMRVCPEYTRKSALQQNILTLGQPSNAARSTNSENGYIFAGGNSFRDFEPLVQVAQQRPNMRFRFCTSRLKDSTDMPKNVIAGPVPQDEYARLIQEADAVIVPISLDVKRIVGVLTYLEAMSLGKLVIVTDAPGAAEYIEDGKTGLIVDGSKEAYLRSIDWVSEPQNQFKIREICTTAQEAAHKRFSKENHIMCLFEIMDELIADNNSAISNHRLYGKHQMNNREPLGSGKST